ncbi:alkene reductase [Methylotenera sp.]|uniref:alkene reductase n=1 Tax=Methylotenera sp. TaxID=2051956 RepID=UPI002487C15E|nr:alkene reductase [Methylotenera sp.]MDI1360525.1 alkene reductase [Methylotenera sp.]
MTTLFDSISIGDLTLSNRVFMAPLTRNRAGPDGVSGNLAATYYAQRATAGLIITEATQISPMGKGYKDTPGIYTEEQVLAWSRVVESVHAVGGKIFLQLWHVGRISHSSLLPDGTQPVAPSAIRARSQTITNEGFVDVSEPRALTLLEIKQTIDDYAVAASNAKKAGFDGVEIHAANGYLIDQFLESTTNHRLDLYGGNAENRTRFLCEVVEAVLSVWDASRVGVRLSPFGTFNDMSDAKPEETYLRAVDDLNQLGLGYLHIVEPDPKYVTTTDTQKFLFQKLRKHWKSVYVVNGGYDLARAESALSSGYADAVSFGRLFIANPDLPVRLSLHGPLNVPDTETFYGGGNRGYIDYPNWVNDNPSNL